MLHAIAELIVYQRDYLAQHGYYATDRPSPWQDESFADWSASLLRSVLS